MSEDDRKSKTANPHEGNKTEQPTKKKPQSEKRMLISGGTVFGLLLNIRMLRRIVQIFFLIVINAYILGVWFANEAIVEFWKGLRNLLPTFPIIAPLEAPFAMIAGTFDTMQREFTRGIFPFFTLGAMIIILAVVGRAACGWVCPIGTIQDFMTLPKRTKIRPAQNTENDLRRVKAYIFFIVIILAVWLGISRILGTASTLEAILGIFARAPFDPLNPAYIIFVVAPGLNWPYDLNTLWYLQTFGPVVWAQLIFAILIFVVSIWVPRWFCRWLCPAGWFYGVFSRSAIIGIGRSPAKCTPDKCNVCETACPMNIRIRTYPYQHMYSPDCIMCLECKSRCPNDAIEIRLL